MPSSNYPDYGHINLNPDGIMLRKLIFFIQDTITEIISALNASFPAELKPLMISINICSSGNYKGNYLIIAHY
jgi:hypothetical protein